MAFIADTQVFTDAGWKRIEDVSGKDRVLVRNFLGEAEFIQPFALKKRKYDGFVTQIGARNWHFSVTPHHPIVFDKNKLPTGNNFQVVRAENVKPRIDTRLYRKFRYIFSEEPKKEIIKIKDEFGIRYTTISQYDWYKLMGYVLMRGFIRKKPGSPMLHLFLDPNRIEEESRIIGDLLDRMGFSWHMQHSEKTSPKIVVSSKNLLCARLITRLGSDKRKEMYLTDKIIYNSTKELSQLLIDTIIDAAGGKDTLRTQLVTTNKAFIDSLMLLGTLSGYSIRYSITSTAGTPSNYGVAKKDSYILLISSLTDTYAPTYVRKEFYYGYVYEIDLFDGQIYVKEGSMPVWVNPK